MKERICEYIDESKNKNKDHKFFIKLSCFTTIKNHSDSEKILEELKHKYNILKSSILRKDHLDTYLAE